MVAEGSGTPAMATVLYRTLQDASKRLTLGRTKDSSAVTAHLPLMILSLALNAVPSHARDLSRPIANGGNLLNLATNLATGEGGRMHVDVGVALSNRPNYLGEFSCRDTLCGNRDDIGSGHHKAHDPRRWARGSSTGSAEVDHDPSSDPRLAQMNMGRCDGAPLKTAVIQQEAERGLGAIELGGEHPTACG